MQLFLSKWLRVQIPIWLVVPMLGLIFVLGLGGGYVGAKWVDDPYPCPQSADVCADFQNFWKTWDLVNTQFCGPQGA